MHQRLNNRWLSERLLEVSGGETAASRSAVRPGADYPAYAERESRPTGTRDRRNLQHLASAALLLGSLAFSYLAWSQSAGQLPRHADAMDTKNTVELHRRRERADYQRTPIPRTQARTHPSTQAASDDQRASVNALRTQNRALHQQLAILKDRLGQAAP